MYATHSKNINKNKSFDPLNGKNQYLKAKKEAEEKERLVAVEKRSAELEAEKRAFKFDSMLKAAQQGEAGVAAVPNVPSGFVASSSAPTAPVGEKRQREDLKGGNDGRAADARWIFAGEDKQPTENANASSSSSPPADTGNEKLPQQQKQVPAATGRISKEEAARLATELDRARKLKNDPLYKAEQLENRIRGGSGEDAKPPPQQQPTSTPPLGGVAGQMSSKQRMAAALAKVRRQ